MARIEMTMSDPDATRITKFDRLTARRLDDEMLAALKRLCEPLGLNIKLGGGRFSDFEFTAKFVITVNSKEAQQDKSSGDEKLFKLYAPMIGLKPEWFGKEFTSAGNTFRIAGYMPKRSKYPVLAVRSDGKRVLFPTDVIRAKFASAQ